MKRIGALLVAGAIAFAGCSKKDDKKAETKTDPADPPAAKVVHGEKGGKGEGGGEKAATGAKDGTKGSAKKADPVLERGTYLAAVGGCAVCHTAIDWTTMRPMTDKAFAGGLTVKEAFGSWTSPNITPDPETGIGRWTDEQIMAGIRDGVRPDGSKIHPIMPWPFYRNMTDDDAKALTAYLKAQKPVVNKVERNKLPEIPLQLPPPNRVDPVDDPVGHGAYLASIMHCVACHTPMTEKGPDFKRAFAGGMEFHAPEPMADKVEGQLFASNITSDPETGIGAWTEEDIIKSFTQMVRPDGRPIMPPMAFYAPFWSQLTPQDAAAVAKFVKAIPPVENKVVSTFKMKAGPPGGSQPQ